MHLLFRESESRKLFSKVNINFDETGFLFSFFLFQSPKRVLGKVCSCNLVIACPCFLTAGV